MHMEIDQAGADEEIAGIDLFDFGLRIADCGLIGDAAIDNQQIADLIALVCGIDDPAVANKRIHHAEIPPHR